ncbi:MAG: PEP-utilizing enzyme, partial [Myxococcota bacterium]
PSPSSRVRGRVRVLRSVSEGQALQPGEILVTRAIDPGWTPLFLTAGGVVLELGSLLSHGAVVAREYGLPAVVNVDTSRLHDGQDVTVDGSRGLVWIHP